jgi:septum site-determining protein MinC
VESGGRVIADGDIFVWGTLHGSVHAGAAGDSSAIVGALVLAPSQLRIGGRFARGADHRSVTPTPAQVARVQGDQIIIEPWSV